MAVYQRPGVYIDEVLNPLAPVVGADTTSVAAFVGASDRGPEAPTLITSWSQYTSLYGGWNTTAANDLPFAVYMFFLNGGSNAYVVRVVDATATPATQNILDATASIALTFTATNPGAWGQSLYLNIAADANSTFSVTVYYGGAQSANIVERFTELSVSPTSTRYAPNIINASSQYVSVAVVSGAMPVYTGATPVQMIGGTNGATIGSTAIAAAISAGVLDTVTNSLVLNAAGVVSANDVNTVIAYAEARGDVFVVIDTATNATVSSVLASAATYTASSHAAVYYPPIVIQDPLSSAPAATRTISPAGAIAGLYMLTDASRGVFKTPAGLQARLSSVVSVAKLTPSDLDSMNSATSPVNAIRYITGNGVVVMGGRTLKAGYVDRNISVRRTLIYLEKALSELTQFAIFENNDASLWKRLTDVTSGFLTSFWSQGGLSGATPADSYFVKCDATTNPQAVIDAGEVRLEVGVALQRPAEFVVIKIGQYQGGTTVTVA